MYLCYDLTVLEARNPKIKVLAGLHAPWKLLHVYRLPTFLILWSLSFHDITVLCIFIYCKFPPLTTSEAQGISESCGIQVDRALRGHLIELSAGAETHSTFFWANAHSASLLNTCSNSKQVIMS